MLLDFSKAVLSTTVRKNDTITVGDWKLSAKNAYTNGFTLQVVGDKTGIKIHNYKEQVELVRQDGKEFSVSMISFIHYTNSPFKPGTSITGYFRDGTTTAAVIVPENPSSTCNVEVNFTNIIRAVVKHSNSAPGILSISASVPSAAKNTVRSFVTEINDDNLSVKLAKDAANGSKYGIRTWQSLEPTFAELKKWSASEGYKRIKSAITHINLGADAMVTLTPGEKSVFTVPTSATEIRALGEKVAKQLESLGLQKSCRLQFFNESNHKNYWPGQNWRESWRFAIHYVQPFRERGWKVAGPSYTAGVNAGKMTEVMTYLKSLNVKDSFDALDWHFYTNETSRLEFCLKQMKDFCEPLGWQVWLSECGCSQNTNRDGFAKALPSLLPVFDKYADYWTYWLLTDGPKFPTSSWLYKTNGDKTALADVYKSSLS